MGAKSPDSIRNIAFCGHGTCGKTSLVESLLAAGGAISRKGSIDEGTSVCDFDDQEKERKHSIDLACASADHGGLLLNFLDAHPKNHPTFGPLILICSGERAIWSKTVTKAPVILSFATLAAALILRIVGLGGRS